jgi:hypothetical protein
MAASDWNWGTGTRQGACNIGAFLTMWMRAHKQKQALNIRSVVFLNKNWPSEELL